MDMEKLVTELSAQIDSLEDKVTEQDATIEKLTYAVEALATRGDTGYDDDYYTGEEWDYPYDRD